MEYSVELLKAVHQHTCSEVDIILLPDVSNLQEIGFTELPKVMLTSSHLCMDLFCRHTSVSNCNYACMHKNTHHIPLANLYRKTAYIYLYNYVSSLYIYFARLSELHWWLI